MFILMDGVLAWSFSSALAPVSYIKVSLSVKPSSTTLFKNLQHPPLQPWPSLSPSPALLSPESQSAVLTLCHGSSAWVWKESFLRQESGSLLFWALSPAPRAGLAESRGSVTPCWMNESSPQAPVVPMLSTGSSGLCLPLLSCGTGWKATLHLGSESHLFLCFQGPHSWKCTPALSCHSHFSFCISLYPSTYKLAECHLCFK